MSLCVDLFDKPNCRTRFTYYLTAYKKPEKKLTHSKLYLVPNGKPNCNKLLVTVCNSAWRDIPINMKLTHFFFQN
jgi:hypothetical protein